MKTAADFGNRVAARFDASSATGRKLRFEYFDQIDIIRLIGRGERDCVLKRLGRFFGFVQFVIAPAKLVVHLRGCGRRRYEWQ